MSAKTREKQKGLHIDVPEILHYEIKKRSLDRNISIRDWVIIAISERIKEERKYE